MPDSVERKHVSHSRAPIVILGISSSPSREGNAARLVRAALAGASRSGAHVDEIHLPEWEIEDCHGCMTCLATGACVLEDDYRQLRERILAADGLVLGSPTYGMTLNARMKTVLERLGLFSVYTSLLSDKYVVGVSTCGGAGARRAACALTSAVDGFFGFGRTSGRLAVRCGWEPVGQAALQRAEALGSRLVHDVVTRRPYRVQRLGSRVVSRILAAAMIKPNILANRRDRMKAVYERLLADGKIRPAA